MNINTIYIQDCFDTMKDMVLDGLKVDLVLTSPPYCTEYDNSTRYSETSFKYHSVFYDEFKGFESTEEYRDWSIKLFNAYDRVLKGNGVILYNLSYTSKNPELPYIIVSDIIKDTNFTVVDCITWKKKSALPQNMNNRLTRICEFVFVFARKTEVTTFHINKIKSGDKYKNLFYNYVEAPNNDILDKNINKLNNATFSTSFVLSLLNMYAGENALVYDSFMGTGTTAVACKQFNCNFIGSELSQKQVAFAFERLEQTGVFNKGVGRLF